MTWKGFHVQQSSRAKNSFWMVAVHINWTKKLLLDQVLFLTCQNIDKKFLDVTITDNITVPTVQ